MNNQRQIERLARIIWEYHHLNHHLKKADLLFVLGSHDIRVAEYAARLFLDGWAPYILFSGGIAHNDDLLNTGWKKSEAEIFAEIAMKLGVPENKIFIESEAGNTGENVSLSEQILLEKGIRFDSIIAVQKPYMERRTFATIKVHWPEKELIISSPSLSYEEYPNGEISKDDLINIMIGDLQRIIKYPALGFQIEQHLSEKVKKAYEELIRLGFTKHMIHY